jgi:phytoene desaturase
MSKRAIVIGAGVAGMATAIRLAVQGYHVHVYEKNAYVGGKLSAFTQNGYSFDAGPSLFVQPYNLQELFTLAGENMQDYLQYGPVPIACKYFYEDGTVVNAYTDTHAFAAELQQKLNEAPEQLHNYLNESEKLYNNVGQLFLQHSLHKRRTLWKARIRKALLSVKPRYLFGTLNSVNKRSFTDARTVQLFNRYATYNGSNPYKAPGMLSLIPHIEHHQGVFYPKGGMVSIANALQKLAEKKGVHFHFNTPVQRIIQHDSTVKGVVVNHQNNYAEVVVTNLDSYYVYKNLLQDDRNAFKLMKREPSSSALVFYWGIDKVFTQLDLHNIFFSKNYKAEFDAIFKRKTFYEDPTVYVNITSVAEPGVHAPQGKANWFVMINVPAHDKHDWEKLTAYYRKAVINKLNRLLQTDIEPLIETESVMNPLDIDANTAAFRGALYGASSNKRMSAFLRHPNFSSEVQGLYFSGGTVHPGGGIPLCLKSAAIVADLVAADMHKHKAH